MNVVRRIATYVTVILINLGKTLLARKETTLGDYHFTADFGASMKEMGGGIDEVASFAKQTFDLFVIREKIKKLEGEKTKEAAAKLKELKHNRVFNIIQGMVRGVKFGLKKGGYELLRISNKAVEGVKGFRGLGLAGKIGVSLTGVQITLGVYSNLRSALMLVRDKMIPHYRQIKEVESLIQARTDVEKNKMRLLFLKNVGTMAIVADTFRQLLKSGSLGCRVAGFIMAAIAGVTMTAVSFSVLPFAIMAIALLLEIVMHHAGVDSSFGIMGSLEDFATIAAGALLTLSSPLSVVVFTLAVIGIAFDAYKAFKSNPQVLSDWYKMRRANPEEKKVLEETIRQRQLTRSLGFSSVEDFKKKNKAFDEQALSYIYGKETSTFEFIKAG